MRELRSCDFCGEDAAGVYEPLPPDLAAERRRAALCPECRDTLADLLEPLRAPGGRDAPDVAGEGAELSGRDRSARAVTVESADSDRTGGSGAEGDDCDAESPSGGGGGSESESATDSGGRTDPGAPAGRSGSRPRGYRKLIRLVSNRESAVSRADLAEVAASAYGIDAEQAERALAAAVANGDLIDEDGRLRVP